MKKLMETIKKARTNERSRTWAAGKPIRAEKFAAAVKYSEENGIAEIARRYKEAENVDL